MSAPEAMQQTWPSRDYSHGPVAMNGFRATLVPLIAGPTGLIFLEQHIEVSREAAVTFTEEEAIRRVGAVPMSRFGIEVIRQVEAADREPH